jgi:hypothetical protein
MVSVGQEQGDDPVAFYVAGDHHSEALKRRSNRAAKGRTLAFDDL